MSLLNLKTSWKYIITILITGIVVYKLSPKQIEYKERIVTEVQERVRTITKIKVSPDGTTETIIDERSERDTLQVSERSSKPVTKEWLISATMTYNADSLPSPTYGMGISKHILIGVYGGLYANTNRDIGLSLSYSF